MTSTFWEITDNISEMVQGRADRDIVTTEHDNEFLCGLLDGSNTNALE